ncbi:hypothetical protein I7I53_04688 [Histoplasma capsulatum var. duboisii H88]|uniref:Uncharacterized protein n=1 Tax=Ajellomyces capsulatus (strain H88) TaxID=544711 RepID=A0A8A1LRC9_AJEC8|nr:hypothetical protein I7I53_04688 [Histoplasma capsulatum var. duboisii H88]
MDTAPCAGGIFLLILRSMQPRGHQESASISIYYFLVVPSVCMGVCMCDYYVHPSQEELISRHSTYILCGCVQYL